LIERAVLKGRGAAAPFLFYIPAFCKALPSGLLPNLLEPLE
jgi:hypothetical protein